MVEKIRSIWTDEITDKSRTETSATTQNVETLINLQALENEQVKLRWFSMWKYYFMGNIEYRRK